MGYFNSLASSAFKENPEGNGWLYYPQGILSKGRVVVDQGYKDKLFTVHKRLIMIGIPLGILYGLSLDIETLNIYQLLVPLLAIIVAWLYQYSLIKDLPVSTVRLRYKESVSKAAKGLPTWYFYLLYANGFLAVLMGILFPIVLGMTYREALWIVCLSIGLGVACIVLGLILEKFRGSKEP